MDKEKEIEEMTMSIAECNATTCDNCRLKCKAYITCEILHEKGYGNIKQAVREFAEKLKEKFTKRISELKKREEECLEVGDWETASRCKVAYTEIENVLNGFDELIKELYGEEVK